MLNKIYIYRKIVFSTRKDELTESKKDPPGENKQELKMSERMWGDPGCWGRYGEDWVCGLLGF